jgi:hypothetical protein
MDETLMSHMDGIRPSHIGGTPHARFARTAEMMAAVGRLMRRG